MMTKKTDAIYVISQDKFYKRKARLLKITHKENTFYGTTFST